MKRLHLSRRAGVLLVAGGVGGLLLIAAAWLIVTGVLARSEVAKAKDALRQLRSSVAAGDVATSHVQAAAVAEHASRAHALTSGPAWWTAAQVPWLGEPLQTVRGASTQADRLGQDALPVLVRVADDLDPKTLRHGNTVDVTRLAAAAPDLHRAALTTQSATAAIAELPKSTWLGSVDRSRTSLQDDLDDINGTISAADRAAQILPTMLGQHGVQRYFVALQNNAESRGLGGLPGAFAILQADHGTVTFSGFYDDSALAGVKAQVDLGADFDHRYAQDDPYGLYVNSNVSPDFRDAAQIWAAMWQRKTGQRVDGAIALDPTALSYFLAVTGPATLPGGEQVGSDNVVRLTESDVYARFPTNPSSAEASNAANAARKAFLINVAKAVEGRLLTGGNTRQLLDAASRASGERRLLVWSTDPAVQQRIEQTNLAGTLAADGHPYAGFTVLNAAGSKLDYYLDRSMTHERAGCGASRRVTATFTLTNSAPRSGLPAYVTSRGDHAPAGAKPGDNRLLVSYYATPGATIDAVTLDGVRQNVEPTTEKGLVVLTVDVELPGASRTVSVTAEEPAAPGPVTVLRQPLVRPMTVTEKSISCS